MQPSTLQRGFCPKQTQQLLPAAHVSKQAVQFLSSGGVHTPWQQ